MTRGRRKDLTIPPSRALLQQRDYRARKAQYLAELEDRCRRAEQENAHLRKEVESLQSRLRAASDSATQTGPSTREMAAASSDLMQDLTVAAASLARFQQIVLTSGSSTTAPLPSNVHTPVSLATPNFTPSPGPHPYQQLMPTHPRIAPPSSSPPSTSSNLSVPSPLHLPRAEFTYGHRDSFSSVESMSIGRVKDEPHGEPIDRPTHMVEDDEEDELIEDGEEDVQPRFPERMSDLRSTATSEMAAERRSSRKEIIPR